MAERINGDPSPFATRHYFWSAPDARRWTRVAEYALLIGAVIGIPLALIIPWLGPHMAWRIVQWFSVSFAFLFAVQLGVRRWARWRAPILGTMEAALSYVAPQFANANTERAVFIGIGAHHGVVFEHVIHGDHASVKIDVRDLLGRALRADAVVFLMFHNHPGETEARPSRTDNDFTRRLARAGRDLGLHFMDHVIVTGENHFSYWADGSLNRK